MRILFLLFLVALATVGDHLTTFLCLRQPVTGFDVYEANPIARVLFDTVGLVPGLLIDSVVTAVAFVWVANWSNRRNAAIVLVLVFLGTSYAVWNNINVMQQVGLL